MTVVRSGPDTAAMRPATPVPELRRGGEHLLVYLGVMGPRTASTPSSTSWTSSCTGGDGPRCGRRCSVSATASRTSGAQCTGLGLDPYVEFTGRVGPEQIARYLSTADVGIGPDPGTPLNDVSTMNKTMKYMAFALPSVAFDLTETRVSGGDLRDDLARRGRERVSTLLDWRPQREAYLSPIGRAAGRGA